MTEYVACFTGQQLWCTHSHCKESTPKCGEVHPDFSWRTCVSIENHAGRHYVPPVSLNYEYWGK